MRRPRKRRRVYRFRLGRRKRLWRGLFVLCAAVLAASLWQVGRYAIQYARTVRLSAELRETYLSADEASPELTAPPRSMAAEEFSAAVTGIPGTPWTQESLPAVTPDAAAETVNPLDTPQPQTYPRNPYRLISERFRKLQRQNKDIIGWLSIDGLLSEAVVQRDNTYYLRRDYRGYHNDNGAIFLDEACNLQTRPYTLTLYAHNMKSGAMFGSLRNYEHIGFYRKNPFVDFDTIYEDGRYVIFSVAAVSIDVQSPRYSGFYRLNACTNLEREAIIQRLCSLSEHTCMVDVRGDDQLLLLVTCIGDSDERRIVAARRIREGETEEGLYRSIQSSQSR